MEKTLITLGIGSLMAVVCVGVVAYIKRIKEKIKGFILERKKIEKYFQED